MHKTVHILILMLFFTVTISVGCITNPSHSDNLPINSTEVTTKQTSNLAASPINPNQTMAPSAGLKDFSKAGISITYPDSYNIVDSGKGLLVRLQSTDNGENNISVYRNNLSDYGPGWGLNTADGIYNTILNEMALAKIHEQQSGTWSSDFRSVKKIVSPSLNAYIVEGNAGSKIYYFIPWQKNFSYQIIFSYPDKAQADNDEINRMSIVDSIRIQ